MQFLKHTDLCAPRDGPLFGKRAPPASSLRLIHHLSLSLSLTFSSPWPHNLHLSLSTLLHRPHYTQIGASPSSHSSVSVTQLIFHHSSYTPLHSCTTIYLLPSPSDDIRHPLTSSVPRVPSIFCRSDVDRMMPREAGLWAMLVWGDRVSSEWLMR